MKKLAFYLGFIFIFSVLIYSCEETPTEELIPGIWVIDYSKLLNANEILLQMKERISDSEKLAMLSEEYLHSQLDSVFIGAEVEYLPNGNIKEEGKINGKWEYEKDSNLIKLVYFNGQKMNFKIEFITSSVLVGKLSFKDRSGIFFIYQIGYHKITPNSSQN